MNRALLILAAASVAGVANAAIITHWNFNDDTLVPQIGAGAASLVGGTTSTFATGSPNDLGSPNRAWNTTGYPAQGTNSGTAGVEYKVSTLGYQNIKIKWDQRNSNTASRFLRMDYTTDGSTWNQGDTFELTAGGTFWQVFNKDMSGNSAVNNNSNFSIRLLAVFEPGTGQYRATQDGSSYGTSGTIRYDLVTFEGDVVPEPASIAALGLGLAAIARKRRK